MKDFTQVLMGLGYDPLKLGEMMAFYLRTTLLKSCFLNECCIMLVLHTYLEAPPGMSHFCVVNLEEDACLLICNSR